MTSVEKINAILKTKHMSRRQLAKKAGLPPSTLQSAISRGRIDNPEMLMKIALALGVGYSAVSDDEFNKQVTLEAIKDGILSPEHISEEMNMPTSRVLDALSEKETVDEETQSKVFAVGYLLALDLQRDELLHVREVLRTIEDCICIQLNKQGREVARERVLELAEIPRYQQTPPQAEARDGENADDTPQEGD